MKKIILSLFVCLLLTGCGGNTLNCTYENEVTGVKMNGEIKATIDGNQVSEVKFVVTTQATSDLTKSLWGMVKPSIETTNEENLKISSKDDEKNYKYTVTIEARGDKVYSSMKSEDSKLGEAFSGGKTYEQVKKEIEAYGYKCK